ncbi:MAG TPA: hypothetical protein VH330_01675 [Candidatus Udaeobacter sp.]
MIQKIWTLLQRPVTGAGIAALFVYAGVIFLFVVMVIGMPLLSSGGQAERMSRANVRCLISGGNDERISHG